MKIECWHDEALGPSAESYGASLPFTIKIGFEGEFGLKIAPLFSLFDIEFRRANSK